MTRADGKKVVFFSHKWCPRDNAIVQRLIGFLAASGIAANSLLVDPVVPTHSIRATESGRIEEADCFAVLWTPEASGSEGVAREIRRQRESGKPIVLIRYFNTLLPDWWDPDVAYVPITAGMMIMCGPNARPIWPGLIDFAAGAKDIRAEVGGRIIRFLREST